MLRLTSLVGSLALLVSCGDNRAGGIDAPPPVDAGPDASPAPPATLAETGLCVDAACTETAPDAHLFTPEYTLWTDGATKRRWIYLPPGAQIDTSDMDFWRFPAGTKLWKEFTRDGTRVETRLLEKTGPDDGDWFYAAYAWNAAQDATTLADPAVGEQDANGTPHDIPSRLQCRTCHDRTPGRVIGFSAILLDHPVDAARPGLTLADAIDLGWLSAPPTPTADGDYFPIPGAGTPAQDALGSLHVNCGHCHNPRSDVHSNVPVVWRLDVAHLGAVTDTPTYTTAVGVPPALPVGGATALIAPHDPAHSAAYLRMNTVDPTIMMPKLGREEIDPAGVAWLAAWIDSL